MKVTYLEDEWGMALESAPHPQQVLKMQFSKEVKEFDMLRKHI